MQQIGEKLEEARKRQGITIREASDATKIRTDFLVAFEQGSFDIKLPEIYRRGFVKNYARFLNMDADKMMIEYSAVTGNSNLSRASRRENRETLGRMEFNPNQSANTKPSIRPSQGALSSAASESDDFASEPKIKEPAGPAAIDNSVYWKIALVLGGGLFLVVLVVSLINVIISFSPNSSDTVSADTAGAVTASDTTSNLSSARTEEFTLIALDSVFVVVTESSSQEQVFKRSLESGEEITLATNGPAEIAYTDPEKLQIRMNGTLYSLRSGYKTSTDEF